jgi:hypothetical protein
VATTAGPINTLHRAAWWGSTHPFSDLLLIRSPVFGVAIIVSACSEYLNVIYWYTLLAFISTTVLLNILLTCLIARKLTTHRREVLGLGVKLHSSSLAAQYSNVITLVVEFALAWIISGVIYIALIVAGSPAIDFWEYMFQLAAVRISAPSCCLFLLITLSATQSCCAYLQNCAK